MRITAVMTLALLGGLVVEHGRADPGGPVAAVDPPRGRAVTLGRPIPLDRPDSAGARPIQPVQHAVVLDDPAVLGPIWDSESPITDDDSGPSGWALPDAPDHDGWTAGGGVYWIQPYFESNTAFRLHRRVGENSLANDYRSFRHHMDAAPLAWIGYEWAGGFGVRGRWFQFEQDAFESITKDDSFIRVFHARPMDLGVEFGTARGSRFDFYSNLRVDVWDLEATKAFHYCNGRVLAAAGVRYAHVSQDYLAFGPRSETDLRITSGHNFNGAGPTLALEGKHCLFNTCLSLYGGARASILFGTSKQTASEVVTVRATGELVHSTLDHYQQADVLPIGELEIGIEYGRCFGKIRAFVQAGFVGQVWWGGGNASNTTMTGAAADNTSNFGFVGAVLRLGFTF